MQNAYISPKTAPADTPFPGTFRELVPAIAQYLGVGGLNNIIGVNFGPNAPESADRDKPWYKTTAQGVPLGWFSWNGSEWITTPGIVASGDTESRPLNPQVGTLYFDTDISVLLMFERGKWRTVAGSPGDVKFVRADSAKDAIEQNPGWVEFTEAAGRVLGVAGAGDGLTEREIDDTVGEESHVLSVEELPLHTHDTDFAKANADGNDYNADQGLLGGNSPGNAGTKTQTSKGTGEGVAHNTMQPTLFLCCLIKE